MQNERALKFALAKFFAGSMRPVFSQMRSYCVARRIKRNRKARGALYFRERQLRAGLMVLASAAAAKADFNRKCKRALQVG